MPSFVARATLVDGSTSYLAEFNCKYFISEELIMAAYFSVEFVEEALKLENGLKKKLSNVFEFTSKTIEEKITSITFLELKEEFVGSLES
jgi:hypothetical protein